MLIIVFYTTAGQAAKARSREIAVTRGHYARLIDASFWDGINIKCDGVEIMPDVPKWQRKRILEVYGDKIIDPTVVREEEPLLQDDPGEMGPAPVEKYAAHRGGGRWFVMAGSDILSGPHDKAEAQRLVGV